MARKQTKAEPMIAVEVEPKSIRLELPPEIHQQFRVEAAKEGMSMAAVARRPSRIIVEAQGRGEVT